MRLFQRIKLLGLEEFNNSVRGESGGGESTSADPDKRLEQTIKAKLSDLKKSLGEAKVN